MPESLNPPLGCIETVLRVAVFAANPHAGQHRFGAARERYVNHSIAVANILHYAGVTDIGAHVAALLHGMVEDIRAIHAEPEALFDRASYAVMRT